MTSAVAFAPASFNDWRNSGHGVSPAAKLTVENVRSIFWGSSFAASSTAAYTETAGNIDQIALDCANANWGGNDELPINLAAVSEAKEVLFSLPQIFQGPEVLPEPHGAVAFEWSYAPFKIFVMSVSGKGIVQFAGFNGHNNQIYGTRPFTGELPDLLYRFLNDIRRR